MTLTGPGGGGKTRLALEVAGHLGDPFRGGICLSPADLREPERIVDTVTDALGLPRSPGAAPLDRIAEALSEKALRGPALLVLDNFDSSSTGGITGA